ncbi:hypothetical protein CEUSTIGMA_g13858.t1 [Chlamydomonas eustigma]|uniref:Uncharacterized protein n=1 Tax=Chlamydomonas eustigma TaxID=1157962 RepID=A0A250XTR6_9CHLO|nr:hypothetical protein CEUSTIGMA_g13858.t1 [Chlamydomonas eustigma]|eukprot:GAX86448.1 hypothetical protein CEUSTIGMA_g13858.t1 [Chlamydomonas eustigma]
MLRGNANTLKGYPNLNQSRNLRPRYCCPLAFHAELVRVQSQHGRSTDVIFTTNIKQSKDEEHLGLVIGERLQEGAPLNCIHITAAVNKLANLRHSRVGSCRHDQCVESQAEVQEQHPKARAHAWISAETMLQPQTQTSVVATLVDELVGLLDCHIDDFQPRQVATILRALSLLPEMALLASSRGLDVKLMTASEHALCHCKPQELCCALSAIARLNWQPSTVWLQAFMTACSSKWSHFNLHELSMVLWSVAKIKWPHNSSITDDRLHTSNSLQKSCPNKSSGAVHSDDGYAGIEKAVLSWIQDLLLHQAGLLPLDGHQLPDISLSIWSLTRMGILPPKLWLTAFSECVTKRLCGFKGRELALILWSLPRVVPRETLLLGHEQWRSDRERKEEEFNHVATGSVINNPSGSPGLYYGQLLESGAHEEGAVAADVSALKDSGDGAGLFHTSHAMRMSLLAKKRDCVTGRYGWDMFCQISY